MITRPAAPPDMIVAPIVRRALEEDLGSAGDLTAACLPAELQFSARLVARRSGVLAGLGAARLAFSLIDPRVSFSARLDDGDRLAPGDVIAEVAGPARALVTAERTALNFLQRLSGVATLTAAYVAAVSGTGAAIAGTRKTTPGLRALEKHALRCGGALPHRFGLDDAIMIKDNHVAAAGGIGAAVARARAVGGHMVVVSVEVDGLDQLDAALAAGPDVILLDNFALPDLAAAVQTIGKRAVVEASGGVNLETVRAIAETGVDVISVGALTHSAPALDLGLDAA